MTEHKQMRHGEILFIEVDEIPSGLIEAEAVKGHLIIGHSESGHHHVIDIKRSNAATHLIDKANAFISYIAANDDCEVEHLRAFDTHAPAKLKKDKKYQVRLRREYTPEGFRKVQD